MVISRNDETLAGLDRCRLRDVVRLKDGGAGHAVSTRYRIDAVARIHRDRSTALPVPARTRTRRHAPGRTDRRGVIRAPGCRIDRAAAGRRRRRWQLLGLDV